MFRKIYNYYSNVILKGNVPPFYYQFLRSTFKLFGIFAKASLSQSSEDVIIEKILKDAKKIKASLSMLAVTILLITITLIYYI